MLADGGDETRPRESLRAGARVFVPWRDRLCGLDDGAKADRPSIMGDLISTGQPWVQAQGRSVAQIVDRACPTPRPFMRA